MATMTYYVALAFKKSEDDAGDIVACDPKEAPVWLCPWRPRKDIAEPSRSPVPAIRLLATLTMQLS